MRPIKCGMSKHRSRDLVTCRGASESFMMRKHRCGVSSSVMSKQVANSMNRHVKKPSPCLGAEQLPKQVLKIMQAIGNKIAFVKAHSSRGAPATHMPKENIPQEWVQARGHWSTTTTLGQYYIRLHQIKDRETLLVKKDASVTLSQALAVPPPPSPIAEPTKEGGSMGVKEGGTARDTNLRAHGVLRQLLNKRPCPACGQP